MQGLVLLVAFVVTAVISASAAVGVGLVLDKFPHVHDLLSVLGFFGTLIVLLPLAWIVAVRLTEPRHAAQ